MSDRVDSTIDWATAFDHFSDEYSDDPFPVWQALQESGVIAQGEDWRGMWVPTRHADVSVVANNPALFTSRAPAVAKFGSMADFGLTAPPISSDPPYHTLIRRLLLPYFAPKRIDELRTHVEELADELIDRFIDDGQCDGAVDYARYIPVRVIARMLGVPVEDENRFFGWVHEILEVAPVDLASAAVSLMDFFGYFQTQLDRCRKQPGDDLISYMQAGELDGRPLDDHEILSSCLLLLLAGIDTTWSGSSASLWHLGRTPDDLARLVAEPELWGTAVEEFLRAYAPVTMAREVVEDTEILGCPMKAGDPMLLPFPAANRDPAVFPDADEVCIDRAENRHVAFGVGIHRCLGSNLARMEMTVALQRFVERIPDFVLDDEAAVQWSKGQVRGPRTLPLRWTK